MWNNSYYYNTNTNSNNTYYNPYQQQNINNFSYQPTSKVQKTLEWNDYSSYIFTNNDVAKPTTTLNNK